MNSDLYYTFLICLLISTSIHSICYQPDIPENGQLTLSSNPPFEAGLVARYSCGVGFVMIGDEDRTCQGDGRWSGQAPLCVIDVAKDRPASQSSGTSAMYAVSSVPMCSTTDNPIFESASWTVNLLSPYKIGGLSFKVGHLSGPLTDIIMTDKFGHNITCQIPNMHTISNETYTIYCKGDDITKVRLIVSGRLHLCSFSAFAIDAQAPWQCGLAKMDVLTVYEDMCFSSSRLQKLDWKSAQNSCYEIGGTLPIRITNVTREVLKSALSTSSSTSSFYWIGLMGSSKGWIWIDGDPLNNTESDWYEKPPILQSGETLAAALGRPALYKMIAAPQAVWNSYICQTKPKYCTSPGLSENAKVVFSSQTFTIGTFAFYSCEYGYKVVGESKRRCKDSGKWSHQIPTCKLISCPEPSTEHWPHGDIIKVNGSISFGSLVQYKCAKGFVFDSQSSRSAFRVCTSEGQWSNNAPSCQKIDCGTPPTISNGIFEAHSTTLNSSATYNCDDNHQLMGEMRIMCGSNGMWQPQPPICYDPSSFKSFNEPEQKRDIALIIIIIALLSILTVLIFRASLSCKSYSPNNKFHNFFPTVLNHIGLKSRETSSGMTSSTLDRSSASPSIGVISKKNSNLVYATPNVTVNYNTTDTDSNQPIYYTPNHLHPQSHVSLQQIEIEPHMLQLHQLPNGNIQLTMPVSRPCLRPAIPLFTQIPHYHPPQQPPPSQSPTNSQILYSFDYEPYYDTPPDSLDIYEEVKSPTGDAHCL
uniref:Sushi, von Willebrand factor type A, EGF and pentraxin domain-containing protein 1 n=1 Tax=Rhabditophanes sp. KR3021 TaxID=114890 RepID=A0AC35UA78_9BILA